ncbi:MAG TPA: helix-turn-helix domain-containing protein [Nonomuraea sp.]|uniref:helix-turn-helix domain-containing protein n=1 Tax=Nonomuraea sp. NPDC049649 TaxID=3155776 RepID=UPI002B92C233|nr:helix-turn-helix domain-containing protein [Nonomuraea sp.]
MTITPPPSPEAATDEAAFMAGLRRLKDWSGLSFRQLERRASAAGDVLPYSTASTMLGRDRLPREELLVAFVRACGLGGDDVLRWVSVRAEIAAGTRATVRPRGRSWLSRSSGRPRGRSWMRTVIAAAVLAVAFTGGAAFAAGSEMISEETVVLTP